MSAPSVKLVEPPDEGEVLAKYAALQKRHQQVMPVDLSLITVNIDVVMD